MSTTSPGSSASPGPLRLGRRALLAGGAAPLLVACTGGGDEVRGQLRIATGNTGAVFERYGRALATELSRVRPGVRASTLRTDGSRANLDALLADRADVAFCLGDTATSALPAATGDTDVARDQAPFLAVARLYDSFLQVVARADGPVRALADLADQRVTAGQVGSGTRTTLARTLAAGGVGGTTLVTASLATSVRSLLSGEVAALGFVSGFPVPALVELGRRTPLRAVDLGAQVPGLVRRWGPQYVAGPLPAAAYGLPVGVDTVSVKTYLVCRPDLDDALVAALLDVVYRRQDAIGARVPDVRQPTLGAAMFTSPVPLHPASAVWFAEQDQQGA